jgi:hypothetical protein
VEEFKVGIYRHYKGNLYLVYGFAIHTETRENLVVYQALYGIQQIYARPATNFGQDVEVDGTKVPRFQFIK